MISSKSHVTVITLSNQHTQMTEIRANMNDHQSTPSRHSTDHEDSTSELSPTPSSIAESQPLALPAIDEDIKRKMKEYWNTASFAGSAFGEFLENKAIWAVSAIANDKTSKIASKCFESRKAFEDELQELVNYQHDHDLIPVNLHPFNCLQTFYEFMKKLGFVQIDIGWLDAYETAINHFTGSFMSFAVKKVVQILTVKSLFLYGCFRRKKKSVDCSSVHRNILLEYQIDQISQN